MTSQLIPQEATCTPAVFLARDTQLIDLRRVNARDLEPLLLEETAEWSLKLDWDFSATANLVRRLVDSRSLSGVALLNQGEVVGYGYTGLDGHKGLIVDLYVRPRWRSANTEALLFRVLFESLTSIPGVTRIEGQLMLAEAATAKAIERTIPGGNGTLRLFERQLMTRDAERSWAAGRCAEGGRFRIEAWSDSQRDAAAKVIWLSYIGHIDAQMDDQYRNFGEAARRLSNLVEFPGSAAFHRPSSYVAYEAETGFPAGISLTSFVAPGVAHISEICVAPDARGAGLGYELLRRPVETLRAEGAKRVTLSVTTANETAVRLYKQCGFRDLRPFCAYVWERRSLDR